MEELINIGSSRKVYKTEHPNRVLKLAYENIQLRNQFGLMYQNGIVQNSTEYKIASDDRCNKYVAAVYEAGPDFNWLISENIKQFKSEKTFKALFGIDFENFCEAIDYRSVKNLKGILAKAVLNVVMAEKYYSLDVGDLFYIEHWGLSTIDGRLTLLDYGCQIKS